MYETESELDTLDDLLTTSLRGSTPHLRSIITEGERTLDAREAVRVLTGMCTLSVATVTASGEPRISGVDGHFLHGRWVFTTAGGAAKARHLRRRPQVSVAHVLGDDLGIYTHGSVQFLEPGHTALDEIERHLVGHYGSSPSSWGDDIVYLRVQPQWMVAYAFEKEKLLRGGA